jgi:hypothetical protein
MTKSLWDFVYVSFAVVSQATNHEHVTLYVPVADVPGQLSGDGEDTASRYPHGQDAASVIRKFAAGSHCSAWAASGHIKAAAANRKIFFIFYSFLFFTNASHGRDDGRLVP